MMEMKNCCQSTLCPFAERFDYAPEEMERMTVGFGGGMGHGDNCGAFVGGYLVLALAFGDDEEKTEEKQRAFREAFTARFGSPYCRELIGYDFAIPGSRRQSARISSPARWRSWKSCWSRERLDARVLHRRLRRGAARRAERAARLCGVTQPVLPGGARPAWNAAQP